MEKKKMVLILIYICFFLSIFLFLLQMLVSDKIQKSVTTSDSGQVNFEIIKRDLLEAYKASERNIEENINITKLNSQKANEISSIMKGPLVYIVGGGFGIIIGLISSTVIFYYIKRREIQ